VLLIDGYNLLHATDLFGVGEHAGTLRGSREALLAFLVARLSEKQLRATTVVFDAADAPPGLPASTTHEGVRVLFSRGYADADSMIEDLIEKTRDRRRLMVVSSDHRVQRAARQRGARWLDSEAWYEQTRRRPLAPREPGKPIGPVDENDRWVDAFSSDELSEEIEQSERELRRPRRRPATPPAAKGKAKKRPRRKPPERPAQEFGAGVFDPFPPGYAEDLLREEEGTDSGDDSDRDTGSRS